MWRFFFPTHVFFWGGGLFCQSDLVPTFCTPKKRENFSPWNRLNWPRSVQLDVLPAALLTVTRGTQGGGELEKIGSAAMKRPQVVNDPHDLIHVFSFSKEHPDGSSVFSVLSTVVWKLLHGNPAFRVSNSKGDI